MATDCRKRVWSSLSICLLVVLTLEGTNQVYCSDDGEYLNVMKPEDQIGYGMEGLETTWGGNITKKSNFEDELEAEYNRTMEASDEDWNTRRKLSSCNYRIGKWARDGGRPAYGPGCKWVRSSFQCVPNGRRDIAFEKWSWAPNGCKMAHFNAFYFLATLRNKVVAIVGDSFSRNFAQSLLCQLNKKTPVNLWNGVIGGTAVQGVYIPAYNLKLITIVAPYLVRYTGEPSAFTKYGLHPGNGNDYVVWLDKPDLLWANAFVHFDLTLFMSGHWYLSDQGTTDVRSTTFIKGGKVLRGITGPQAYTIALKFLKNYVTSQRKYRGVPMYLTYSPSHYSPGRPPYCSASSPATSAQVAKFERRDISSVFSNIERATFTYSAFRIVDITHISNFRNDAHVARFYGAASNSKTSYDCTHWCLPGVPDIWTDTFQFVLLTQLHRAHGKYVLPMSLRKKP